MKGIDIEVSAARVLRMRREVECLGNCTISM